MTRRRCGWLLSILAFVAAPALTTLVAGQGSLATRKAEAALQAAMNKETVAGDLPGAIKDYNAIVTQYGRSDQSIAAQALMRAAGAYEKLGKTAESRQVYAQIAKDYAHIARGAGDRDIVTAARTRYAALTPAAPQAPGIRPRRVMTMQTRCSERIERGWHARGGSSALAACSSSTWPQVRQRSLALTVITCLLPGRQADHLRSSRRFGCPPARRSRSTS